MLIGEGLHVVGEVFPLVIDSGRRGIALAHIVAALYSVAIERQRSRRTTCTTQTITKTRRNGQIGNQCEVAIDTTSYIVARVLAQAIVTHDHGMILLTVVELRDTIVVSITILQESLTHSLISLIGSRKLFTIGVRGQRIHHQHSCQQRAVLAVRRNLAHIVFFHLIRGTHFQPVFYLIFTVDGGCQTLIGISVALHDTIVVQVREGQIIVTAIVTACKREVVLLHVSMCEGYVRPLGVGLAVPVGVDVILCEEVTLNHILLILLSTQHLRDTSQTLVGPLEVVANLALSGLTFLGRNQHNTITSLSTIDGSRSSVLQDFHRSDGGRVDTTNVAHAHTIHHVEGL